MAERSPTHVIAIVESRADRASSHICERLRELADWEERTDDGRPDAEGGATYHRTDGAELRSFDALHLELERPADAFDCDPEFLVFASRHSGDTGPLLTGHFTGNFGPAEFGGDDRSLAEACPNALAALLEAFDERAPEGYDVGLECTHHGPTDVGCPSLFAELGSDEAQWDDPAGAEAVARAILDVRDAPAHRDRVESGALAGRRNRNSTPRRQVVGFGGNHYAPRFERIVRETPWAVGHIAADWALEAMGDPRENRAVLDRAFEASGTDLAVIDDERPDLEAALADLGYRTVSETWLREVGDRPRSLADAVEAALGAVDDGVRFGEVVPEGTDFAVIELPEALVTAAEGCDPDAVRGALERRTVAFETENGGSRAGARAAVPSSDRRARIVEAVAEVLESKYDRVAVEEDAVVAERTAFDPALAREAGVPEGPKFGALASGDPVTVDGETVAPDDVRSVRRRRFPLG